MDFVVAISYGNYLIQNGGTDKVIREHRDLFARAGVDFLFLFPSERTIGIGPFSRAFRWWGLDANTALDGLYSLDGALARIAARIAGGDRCLALFVHHAWRVGWQDLTRILSFLEVPVYYYLHDFHPVCAGKNLMAPDGFHCGYGLSHFRCKNDCPYYPESCANREHLSRIIVAFGNRLLFVAPSDSTRNIFRKSFPGHEPLFVTVPHQRLSGTHTRPPAGFPLKLAFVGKQATLKGWDDYKALVDRFSGVPEYKFFYFGTGADIPPGVEPVDISVLRDGPDAMVHALAQAGIDVVFLLSRWPETYSYTFFESHAAGCSVAAFSCGGNIADMVRKTGDGCVAENMAELVGLLQRPRDLLAVVNRHGEERGPFPSELLPNGEIVSRVLSNPPPSIPPPRLKTRREKRCHFATLLYRLSHREHAR